MQKVERRRKEKEKYQLNTRLCEYQVVMVSGIFGY